MMRRLALASTLVVVAACSQTSAGCDPIEPEGSETLHLYVSNQSFEIDPVDIEVYIDGQPVVCDEFLVEGQHNWIEFDLSLDAGTHQLRAVGDDGNVTFEDSFDIEGERWAVLDFWYYPPDPKEFTFHIQDTQVLFM